MVTGCSSSTVPLSLVIEGPSVEEISQTVAGSFQYLEGSGDEITRTAKMAKHDTSAAGPQADQSSASPKAVDGHLSTEAATNSYDYPSQQSQHAPEFQQGNGDMISTYRSTSFTDPHYHRRPAPGWSGFGATLGSTGSYHPISLYSSKAVLKINGKLDTMAENWTQDEWDSRRRIVMFRKSQAGSTLTASFRAVPVNDRPPNSICIS